MDEKTRAAYLARLFLYDTLQDIPLTIWYDWHDDGTNLKDQEHNFGTVHYAYHEGENPVYEAKPAYFTAKTYADELRGYRFQERLQSAPDDYLLSFVRPGKVRWVAWTAGAPHTIKLPLDGVYETMKEDGKPGPLLKADQGTTKILLTGFPQYFWKK